MLRRTFFAAIAIFLGAMTLNAEEVTQPVRGGLRIGDYSVSIGHQ